MSVLVSWPVVGVVVPLLIAIGIGVLSMTPPDFLLARGSFTLAVIIFLGKLGWWLAQTDISRAQKASLAFLLFGFTGIGWVESWRWVSSRREIAARNIRGVTVTEEPAVVPKPAPQPLTPQPQRSPEDGPPPATAPPKATAPAPRTTEPPKAEMPREGQNEAAGPPPLALIPKIAEGIDEIRKSVVKPSARRVLPGQWRELVDYLSSKPGRLRVSAVVNDPEAYQFADDILSLAKAARWETESDTVRSFISTGRPVNVQVQMRLRGEFIPGEEVRFTDSDPMYYMGTVLKNLTGGSIAVAKDPNQPENFITVEVYGQRTQ
jgi:hypothetical protein